MSTSIPISWAELLAPESPRIGYHKGLDDVIRVAPKAADDDLLAMFAGGDRNVAALAVLDGTEVARSYLDRLAPLHDRFARAVGIRAFMTNTGLAADLLSYTTVAESLGLASPPGLAKLVDWIDDLATYVHKLDMTAHRPRMAFLAIAHGREKLVKGLVGGRPPKRFEAARTFGFDVPGFVHYLAAAAAAGVEVAQVEPAWSEFVQAFPHKLAARTLDYPDLFAAARAFHGRIARTPPGQIAARLRAQIEEMSKTEASP